MPSLQVVLCLVCLSATFSDAADRRRRTCLSNSTASSRVSQGVTLKLQSRGWLSHRLVTAVAKIILEEELRFDAVVEEASEDQLPNDDYEALAKGVFDANFELWPMGKSSYYERWVTDEPDQELKATDAGAHSVPQRSGLYIPTYTAAAHPEMKFYSHLNALSKLSDYSSLVKQGNQEGDPAGVCSNRSDAAWEGCNNFVWQPNYCVAHQGQTSACSAQLLRDVTGHDQGVLEQQIRNNRLNISVVYLGHEQKAEVVWKAYSDRKPFMFYHYEPSPGVLGLSMDHFSKVTFPPAAGQRCGQNAGRPNGTLRCELRHKSLQRIVSPMLRATPDAFHFASVFDLSETDYAELFSTYSFTDASGPNAAEDAACRWLRTVGPQRWKPWIHYTMTVPFEPGTSECWQYVYFQFAIFAVLLVVYSFVPSLCKSKIHHTVSDQYFDRVKAARKSLRSLVMARSFQTNPAIDTSPRSSAKLDPLEGIAAKMRERSSTVVSLTTRILAWLDAPVVQVKLALHTGKMTFMSYSRDMDSFMEDDAYREGYLVDAPSAFRIEINSKRTLFCYLMSSCINKSLGVSAALSVLAGSLGTLLHLYRQNLHINAEVDPYLLTWFEGSAVALTETISDFKFLPVFLIGMFVSRETSRWLQWIDAVFMVQAGIHNICIAVAGALQCADDLPDVRKHKARIQYTFYRYVNALHYLVYFGLDPRIGTDATTVCLELCTVGLLNDDECAALARSHPKMRDTMIAWLSVLWHQQVQAGYACSTMNTVVVESLMKLRGAAATPLCIEDVRPPTVIKVMLRVVTCVLIFLVLVSYPLNTNVSRTCLQWWAMLQTYLFTLCYVGMLFVMSSLANNPLHPHSDCINIDVLLCDTETMAFHAIRAGCLPRDRGDRLFRGPDDKAFDSVLPSAHLAQQFSPVARVGSELSL